MDKELKRDTLAILATAQNHLEQYAEYAEKMREIGRGFEPSSGFSPEYLHGLVSSLMVRIAND